jgi:nucleoside-diphosphate-sugar epimerase
LKPSVLITGSRGFLGIHLKKALKLLDYEVHEYVGDIREINGFNKPINVVFHLAAKTKGIEFIKNKSTCFDINITGTQQILNYCTKNNARLIFMSTSAVYKSPEVDTLINEDYPLQPKNSYAISKYIAENLCKQYYDSFGFPITILRIFNLYGEGQKEPYLVPYIINRLVKDELIELRMPDAKRDLIYVDDAVNAIIAASVHQKNQLKIYNIGSGRNVRVIDFLHTAEQIFQKKAKIKVVGDKYKEVPSMVADNKKALKELRLIINFGLKDGIQKIKESIESS